jgi:hypothetical protein
MNLDEVEAHASALTLPRDRLSELFEIVPKKPWGYAYGIGGKDYSDNFKTESTYLECAWFSWRKKKFVYLEIARKYFLKNKGEKKESEGFLTIDIYTKGAKGNAYILVLPDRYRKLSKLKDRRFIKKSIRHLPPLPDEKIDSIWQIYPDIGGLAYALMKCSGNILIGTPAGWLQANKCEVKTFMGKETTSAWIALKRLGFPVPHFKKDRVWNEELTAYLVAYALS